MKVMLRRRALVAPGLLVALCAALPAAGHELHADTGQTAAVPANGRIVVIGKEFKFIPNAIRVKKGQHVAIVFKNKGKASHNLTIPELGLHTKTIHARSQATLEFTATKAGRYRFWCTVPGHKGAGMKGVVTVSP